MQIAVAANVTAVRSGLLAMLEETHHGAVCDTADPLAWAASISDPVTVVVVDGEDGVSMIVDLCAASPGGSVVALVRDGNTDLEYEALVAGAAAVESWNVDPPTLGMLVDLAATQHTVMPSHLARQVVVSTKPADFSADELGMLSSLAAGGTVAQLAAGRSYSEREMYRRLATLYRRLGARNRQHALMIAVHRGLIKAE